MDPGRVWYDAGPTVSVLQFRLPWDSPAAPVSRRAARPTHIDVEGRRWPLTVTRHARARRFVLRLTADGGLRLTVPRGASLDGGLRFVRGQGDWIQRQHYRRESTRRSWQSGMTLPVCGDLRTLDVDDHLVRLGEWCWPRAAGAPVKDVVEAGLRAVAATELALRCHALAAQTGDHVSRVTIRNQRSRWGSCSTARAIALNWRLMLMPPAVSDYIIFHELMHLRQPNHSRAFWREVASVCPGWREAERWLRRHGRELLS